jgi:hypothetical protein
MNLFGRIHFRILVLAASQIMGGALIAGQPASVESPAGPANGTNGNALVPTSVKSTEGKPEERKSVLQPDIPALPLIKSPVAFFKELLEMTPSQRLAALSNRPPEIRKQILAKVREYRSMSENERKLRLQATELEWYLVPLMKMPSTNRAARLVTVPEEYRQMIQTRLDQWDILPESAKRDLLLNRESIRLYIQMMAESTVQTNVEVQPPAMQERVRKIQTMSDAERQRLISLFNQYFDLSDREKQRVLRTLSRTEQEQIAKSLSKFGNLTAEQRTQCIRSFNEFSKMSYAERQQFLKNAERWIVMTPDQRRAWQEVVEKAALTPPGLSMPPKPTGAIPTSNRKDDARTNGD